ncbi:hypothetical protein Hanom_Chr00s000001g01593921 [Helianthus anomalus]
MQRRRKVREVLLLEYTTDKFVLVGDAYQVPYNGKETVKLLKFFDLKKKGKIARGEPVEDSDDSDILFGDDEGEDEDDDEDNGADNKSDKNDKPNDDDDQGTWMI